MASAVSEMQAIISIGGELKGSVQKAIKKASKEASSFEKKCQVLNKSIGKIEKAALVAGAALTTAFAGAAAVAGKALLDLSAEYRNAANTIQKSTGATGAELEKLSTTAREIWKSGLGENMQEVAAALSNVEQTSGLAGEELKKATQYGMLLSDTFEFDIAESSRAASALMKNFGITSEEAYGIIATGAQNGANKNGDLLDTLNEYSVHYKALGLNAEQFVTSLIKGAEAGSWSVDKVGDAVKEFTIRSKDGSKKSLEAFQMLGLNGAKMTKDFAKGGESAAAAFKQTVKALQAMKDPVKQNAAGVALFGTMFEDLEAGMLDTMASMETASVDAAKAIKGIEDTASGGITATITRIWRTMKDTLYPVTETINNALKEYAPVLEDLAARALPIVQGAVQELNGYVQEALAKLKDWLANLDMEAIKAQISEIVNTCKEWAKWIIENRDTLASVAKNVMLVYAGFKTVQTGIAIWQGVTKAITAVKTAYKFLTAEQTKQKIAQISSTVASKAATVATWAQVAAQKAATAAQWLFNAALNANPIGLVIAAIAALVAAVWYCWKNWDKITAWMKETWQAFANRFPETAAFLTNAWNTVCSVFKARWDAFVALLSAAWEGIKLAWAALCDLFTGNWSGFCNKIGQAFRVVWDGIKTYVKGVLDSIMSFIQPIIDKVRAIGDTLGGLKDKAAGALEGIKNSKINPANWFAAGGFTNGVSICGEAGTEAVISFDPAYRKENIGYWRTAGEMLGAFDNTTQTSFNRTTVNVGGITFQPVIKAGDNVDRGTLLQQLRACMPDFVDMVKAALIEEEAHSYA